MAELRASGDLAALQVARLESKAADLAEIRAEVVWSPVTNRGILRTVQLPIAPAGQTYQLWIFEKGNPSPRPAGVFPGGDSAEIAVQPAVTIRDAAAFAVSIEPAGGSPQPTGPVILLGGV
jgi:anti-sigma-K factor RskA